LNHALHYFGIDHERQGKEGEKRDKVEKLREMQSSYMGAMVAW